MKITKIGFSKTFPTGPYFEKIFLEAEVIEGDDIRQSLYALKKEIEQFHYQSVAAEEKQMGTVTEAVITGKSQEQTIIEGINSCTELKVLESYRLIASGSNREISHAYNLKLKQLS
jgi:hypothetical protein